jgi:hypothetical protein
LRVDAQKNQEPTIHGDLIVADQPKTTKISIKAEELASLDLLIGIKQGTVNRSYTDAAVTAATAAAMVTVYAAAPVAAAGAAIVGVLTVTAAVATNLGANFNVFENEEVAAHMEEAIRQLPLDELIKLRNSAIVKSEE